jgi:Holliday junction resolvase RusA-like endonuclease
MEAGEIRPVKKPDVDNIIKVVADSLNQVAYRDDADLVKVSLEKFYGRQPRIEVEIETLATSAEGSSASHKVASRKE